VLHRASATLVRRRASPAAHARPAQPRVLRLHGGYLPRAVAPYRRRSAVGDAASHVVVAMGESGGGRAIGGRDRAMTRTVMVIGGGLAGVTAALRCADRGF